MNFDPFRSNQNHFFDNFMHKTFAQFILHTFWCILMHIDVFWALRKKLVIFNQKKKIDFFKLKFHTQNIRIIHSAYSLMHFDAFWCILMHSDAYWCLLPKLNVIKSSYLLILCTKHLHSSFDAFWCTWCILMHTDAFWCMLAYASKCMQNELCKVF